MEQMMQQQQQQQPQPGMDQAAPDAGVAQLAERFAQVALSPEFAEVVQGAFDNIKSPVHAVAFLLAQMVQQVEAKIGPIKDEVMFADSGPAQVFVAIILAMAEEAGLQGAGTPEAARAALSTATALLATSEVMAEMQGGEQDVQTSPQQAEAPQFGGLMA